MSTLFGSGRIRAVAGVLTGLLLLLVGQPAPANAAGPAAPIGLTPDGVAVDAIPVLSWTRSPGATTYNVELSTSSSFTTSFWGGATTNHQIVPTIQLPTQTIYWRVRASSSAGASPWSTATLDRNALAGPTQLAPADGALLNPPFDPALTTWTPIPGAKTYTLEWSTDPNFTAGTQTKTAVTKTTSSVTPLAQIATTYYWHVRATLDSGVNTQWSASRSYQVGGMPKPVLTGPADDSVAGIVDIVLDWEPVMGAKTYNVQVSTDQNFAAGNLDVDVSGVTGTQYSPPVTLANDTYYWRVQPVDAADNKLDWAAVDTWTFRRHWPDQPALEYPANNASVSSPVFFQWKAVSHASSYVVQVSTSNTFPSGSTTQIETTHTTWTPTAKWTPTGSTGLYYWRVVAVDAPGRTPDNFTITTDFVSAEIRQFTYDPSLVTLTSPAAGASVEVPTLSWAPLAGAESYLVTITPLSGGAGGGTFTTNSTSYTPRLQLTPGESYRWDVRSKSSSGYIGGERLPGAQRTFNVVASTATLGATPEPTNAPTASPRFPTLTWTPVTNATSYRVLVRLAGTTAWTRLTDRFAYPAGEDDTLDFGPGSYEWTVEAYNGSTTLVSTGSTSTFQIAALPNVNGLHLALTGTASDVPGTSCATSLPDRCMDLRQTPVLAWNPVNAAAGYYVYLARDEQMTNILASYPRYVEQNKLAIPATSAALVTQLPDSQAGSAYYWVVVPCVAAGDCAGLTHATHAFNKLSKPVQPLSPAAGATVANDVTFSWRDYLATNADATAFPVVEPTGVSNINPRQEARQYRIQVSSDANFQTLLTNRLVDQLTYNSFDNTYPEGPLYWRVQAVDGSTNNLAWSATTAITKSSPTVVLTEPINSAHVSGSVPLRWEPIGFAASYDVEVYKDNDTTGSTVNRVDSGNTQSAAASWVDPMTVSPNAYTWRVRPVDARGRKGQWTDLADPAAKFFVVGDSPVLSGPAEGVFVLANDALFTWQGVSNATSYKFERRLDASSSTAESVTTPALAYAPRSQVADGSWVWRVTALDASGRALGTSAWRAFRTDATPPKVKAYSPQTTMSKAANLVVTFTEPVTIPTKQFRIRLKGTTTNLLATVTLNAAHTKATLNPSANLKVGKTYVVSLTNAIKDVNGNRLTAFTWNVKVV